ncbi:hypothetical protein MMC18_008433 [Xylographa bjoerkii]|nr:hypothetical protein [Xylographa bjoerkii]
MTVPEKRPLEASADADGIFKRPKLGDAKDSEQYPPETNHVSSTVLISNFPSPFDPWLSITREPRIGEGLISMVIKDPFGNLQPSAVLSYRSPTHAEAMLYRSAKTLSDRYGLLVRLEDAPSTEVPKPRNETSSTASPFGPIPSTDAKKPCEPKPPVAVGNLFGRFPYTNAQKLFGSAYPSRTSFGLPPATSAPSTSNIIPSPFTPTPGVFGHGIVPLSDGFRSAANTASSFTPQNMPFLRAAFHSEAPKATEMTVSTLRTYFGFAATPPSNVPKHTENSTSSTNMFSRPLDSGSTGRADNLKGSNANNTPATAFKSPCEDDSHGHSLNSRPTVQAGPRCPACKEIFHLLGGCYCTQAPPPGTPPSSPPVYGVTPRVRLPIPNQAGRQIGTAKKRKAF